jgi:hypothetical protein
MGYNSILPILQEKMLPTYSKSQSAWLFGGYLRLSLREHGTKGTDVIVFEAEKFM